jgi:hypothetical protein
VAAQHFVGDPLGDIIESELALFFGNTRMKYDVEQQIAQFFL